MTEIGFQLSSLAPFLTDEEGLRTSLVRLGAMGYRTVQLQGVSPEIPDRQIRAALENAGLRCVAVQEDDPLGFGKDPLRSIERAAAVGASHYVFALIPPHVNSPEQMKYYADQIAKLHQKVTAAGLKLAFHPIPSDFRLMWNIPVYQRLLDLLPGDVQLCLCIHATFGRASYAEVLEKYRGRCELVHFKDSVTLPDGTQKLLPLGEGEHNWSPILAACQEAGVRWVMAEQETWDRDPFDCAETSYRYLRQIHSSLSRPHS